MILARLQKRRYLRNTCNTQTIAELADSELKTDPSLDACEIWIHFHILRIRAEFSDKLYDDILLNLKGAARSFQSAFDSKIKVLLEAAGLDNQKIEKILANLELKPAKPFSGNPQTGGSSDGFKRLDKREGY